MAIPITTITVTMPRDPSLFAAEHNRFSRAANIAAAEFHWQKHIPRHFEAFAAAKYGYWKRTNRYLKRKRHIVGNEPDNVFSGRTRRTITTTPPIIRATPRISRLIMKLPISGTGRVLDDAAAARLFKAGIRKTKGFTNRQANSQIQVMHRVAELQVVSADEARKLALVRADEYTRLASQPGIRKRIRIRSQ